VRPFRGGINLGLDRFSGLYLWGAFIIAFSIWEPNTFPTASTVHSVASFQAINAIMGIAALIPLAANQFDLSIGANAQLTGITAAVIENNLHWNLLVAILFSIAIGALIGCTNAFIVIKFRVSSFIVTLGMGSVLGATQIIVTGNQQPNPVLNPAWGNWTQFHIAGFQVVVLYMLIIAVVAWWFLEHTPGGRYIYATGANAEAARLSGINVDRWSATTLILSGTLAGFSGVLYTSLNGSSSLQFGSALLLPAFASAFLGSTQIKPGRFNVWGMVLMIYVLATGVQGLQLINGAVWLSQMFNGVALILAVSLAATRQRQETSGKGHRRRIAKIGPAKGNEPLPPDLAGNGARAPVPAASGGPPEPSTG